MTTPSAYPEEALRFLELLARPGDVFELRGLSKRGGRPTVWSGFFDDMKLLARSAVERSGRDDGVYVTINPVHSGLLSRLPKNRMHQAGNGDTSSDKDITKRRHLLIDVDPVRPAGISSTDEEHAAAVAMVAEIAAELAALGWPEPLVADSGNGGHLIYAIDLPSDDGHLVSRVLSALSRKFSTPALKIDEKVFNPARISKIYGTLTRKGENTQDRPHRISRIVSAPSSMTIVTREQLESFAPAAAPTPQPNRGPANTQDRYTPRGDRPKFDLDAFITEHLPDAQLQDWSGGEHGSRKWLLPVCPFNNGHDRREAFIVEMNSGAVSAGCKHDSCVWGWRDLRRLFEPERAERQLASAGPRSNGNGNHAARRLTDREPPPEVIYQAPSISPSEAAEIDALYQREREAETPDARSTAKTTAPAPAAPTKPPPWFRGPQLVDEIMRYAAEPWVSLLIGGEELGRVRNGGIVVIMGGSGSGKSSLTSGVLVEHAQHVGPAIALSIELPAEEFGGRVVGMRCDASWEESLRGQVRIEFMRDALDLPRLYVIDQENATLENLERAVTQAKLDYPGESILVAIDYAQLLESKEREVRMQVTDAFKRINRITRKHRVVALAVSQMSRSAAQQARDGEKLGVASADGGAESAAIERFATMTLAIGAMSEPRQDGSRSVELSLGKGRMTGGDRVFPMEYVGRTGRWRIAGSAKMAAEVRDGRDAERSAKLQASLELALLGAAMQSAAPMSREDLCEQVQGRGTYKRSAVACLVARGDLVEVAIKKPRSRAWLVWTPDRALEHGNKLVRDMEDER